MISDRVRGHLSTLIILKVSWRFANPRKSFQIRNGRCCSNRFEGDIRRGEFKWGSRRCSVYKHGNYIRIGIGKHQISK